ncbi:hypothetical protein QBC33DRAFT_249818 [Phialemonium atrogriseum]|uniref:Allergen Asp f 4 n=1 Tax=Phialemonium atrogriseum TaxID=1093897 RepID=A0AAJ0BRF9_9PEZI|nr:uncharacterized protein QBC33DRAFT_249818 [Phialemonium atrogriseum]KAK1763118.1 hypothetical protein QBC33DRAFT_249818 [Phialemonium atrogriseum]
MQLTNLVWLAAALGVAAHPSGHAHQHRSFHAANDKRGLAFYKAEHRHPVKVAAPASTTAPPPVSTPSHSSSYAAAASSLSDASVSDSSASAYKPFCNGLTSKRATAAEIAYTGNTGVAGQWGCNIMLVDQSVADKYKYTSVYTNRGSQSHQVTCFNKIGPEGLINGFFGFSAVTFNLAPGEQQVVAFDSNTQGACAFHAGSLPKTNYGEWAGSWVEFDFENTSNGGWSGADCSSLVAQAAGLDVPGCQVCSSGTCSTIYPGGRADNAYIKGMEADDGVGLNIAPGTARLSVTVGFSG